MLMFVSDEQFYKEKKKEKKKSEQTHWSEIKFGANGIQLISSHIN